jgi:hypothetical protein
MHSGRGNTVISPVSSVTELMNRTKTVSPEDLCIQLEVCQYKDGNLFPRTEVLSPLLGISKQMRGTLHYQCHWI